MLVFPNCKINIGLNVTAKRPDGFHEIETVFLPIPWFDALEIIESEAVSLSITGIEIPGDPSKNLCIQAWQLLKTDFSALPSVDIYLHKTIPAGAGLGGGSSNGAFMLKALNEKFNLGLTKEKLLSYALKLGSDCPFFILNKPVEAKGRGELMKTLLLKLAGYFVVLVNPGIHVPTGWAFGELTPAFQNSPLSEKILAPISQWENSGIMNDFEKPVFKKYPVIKQIKDILLNSGALFAAMSGTGSTCFGIYNLNPLLSAESFPANCFVKTIKL